MLSNVFQILQDLRLKQCQETNSDSSRTRAYRTSTTDMTCTTTQLMPLTTYDSTPADQNTGMATPITGMSESSTASRTTMPTKTTPSSRQPTSEIHQNTSRNGLPQYYVHVQQPTSQVCKPGEPPALRKVKTPHNGKTSVSRFPSAKQDISSHYSGCFEGIGHFPGDPCKFHLKPDHQPARHASKKQGISEEVNEHTDWVHSNIFVQKALEREPYYTHSTGDYNRISKQGKSGTYQTFPNTHGNVHGRPPHPDHRENPTTASSRQNSFAQLSNTQHFSRLYFQTCRIPTRHGKYTSFPREPVPARKREKYGYRYIYIREHYSEQVPCTQHTYTSGYRARKSSTKLPTTEDGKFRHGGTSMLQLQC